MKHGSQTHSTVSQKQKSRQELALLLLCGGSAAIAWITLISYGKLGSLASFNFLTVTLSAILIPASLIAKKTWAIRTIAIIGMTIVIATAFVNPPWVGNVG